MSGSGGALTRPAAALEPLTYIHVVRSVLFCFVFVYPRLIFFHNGVFLKCQPKLGEGIMVRSSAYLDIVDL